MAECRFCAAPLSRTFADLGTSPPSNAYLRAEQLDGMEAHFPLHVFICDNCWLVQLPAFHRPAEIFSDICLLLVLLDLMAGPCERYARMASERFALGPQSLVIEVASNDGYLLRFFKDAGVPVLGIEPAAQRRRGGGSGGRADAGALLRR